MPRCRPMPRLASSTSAARYAARGGGATTSLGPRTGPKHEVACSIGKANRVFTPPHARQPRIRDGVSDVPVPPLHRRGQRVIQGTTAEAHGDRQIRAQSLLLHVLANPPCRAALADLVVIVEVRAVSVTCNLIVQPLCQTDDRGGATYLHTVPPGCTRGRQADLDIIQHATAF